MWQLIRLAATNICSFEQLDYSPLQNQATLVFGNNLDNESQNSNGSGKSALIEALAIGVMGEPLRKVNVDEIINDRFDTATVSTTLSNNVLGQQMTVNRKLSRKNPQEIQILVKYREANEEEIKQATISDYNKYVLETIGLSKDDILRNFILTARKYQSFLSSSDKDKKEIINRFSNGIMVDESIAALHADMGPIQEELLSAERKVSECSGRVSALTEEIYKAVDELESRTLNRQNRIKEIQELIADKRNQIRLNNEQITAIDKFLVDLDGLDAQMQDIEQSEMDSVAAYAVIKERFAVLDLPAISDFDNKIANEQQNLCDVNKALQQYQLQSDACIKEMRELENALTIIEQSNTKRLVEIDNQDQTLNEEIQQLRQQAMNLRDESSALAQRRNKINLMAAELEKQLAGVIECPKCHYEFTLQSDIDVKEARAELNACTNDLTDVERKIKDATEKYDECIEKGKAKRNEQSELDESRHSLQTTLNTAKTKLLSAQDKQATIAQSIESAKNKLNSIQDSISGMRKRMFDEVFDTIDSVVKKNEQRIDNIDGNIAMANGRISAYEEQIKELENADDNELLSNLKASKAKYESDLLKEIAAKEIIEASLNKLKIQESTFIEFKTYLANSKIEAISQITNNFLETIGSDIRVALSGYTILKSGKVRDRISVSLIRDGIDCGSFDKFSAGEKCRVELASVLALHKLSNVNCEEGKGLNLLVIDEILDCTDETGLANVFKALNDTQVTALVVSHGNIAENYPNRLVVTKQNGISVINERTN